MPDAEDLYYEDLIAEEMAEAYGIKPRKGWLDSVEQSCKALGMDFDELLRLAASLRKRASRER